MKHNRWDSVELEPSGTIPLLMACGKSKADGVALRPKQFVRVVDLRALQLFAKDSAAFEHQYGAVPPDMRERLLGLMVLVQAYRNRDATLLSSAYQRLASDPWPELAKIKRHILEHQPGLELGRLLAEGLKDVQLVLWQKEAGKYTLILPGLYCPDSSSALYALALLYHVEGEEGLGACKNCGKVLIRKRTTRKFCSDSCRYKWFEKHSKKLRKASARKRR